MFLRPLGVHAHMAVSPALDPGERVLDLVLVVAELEPLHALVVAQPDDQVAPLRHEPPALGIAGDLPRFGEFAKHPGGSDATCRTSSLCRTRSSSDPNPGAGMKRRERRRDEIRS